MEMASLAFNDTYVSDLDHCCDADWLSLSLRVSDQPTGGDRGCDGDGLDFFTRPAKKAKTPAGSNITKQGIDSADFSGRQRKMAGIPSPEEEDDEFAAFFDFIGLPAEAEKEVEAGRDDFVFVEGSSGFQSIEPLAADCSGLDMAGIDRNPSPEEDVGRDEIGALFDLFFLPAEEEEEKMEEEAGRVLIDLNLLPDEEEEEEESSGSLSVESLFCEAEYAGDDLNESVGGDSHEMLLHELSHLLAMEDELEEVDSAGFRSSRTAVDYDDEEQRFEELWEGFEQLWDEEELQQIELALQQLDSREKESSLPTTEQASSPTIATCSSAI